MLLDIGGKGSVAAERQQVVGDADRDPRGAGDDRCLGLSAWSRRRERWPPMLLRSPEYHLAGLTYVLESSHEVARGQVAEALRAILAFRAIRVVDAELLRRAVEVYEVNRLDFADAYLVACAERTGAGMIASSDRSIDRVGTIRREEP